MPVGDGPGRTRSSSMSRETKPSGTGWICRIHRRRGGGAARRICWSGRWRIRASGAGRWSQRPISRTWCRALDRVTRALGGVTKTWRFDRMATVCDPGSGRITASFAGVAKHYSVCGGGVPAPARQPQGCGGKGQSHCRATLVAHPARRCHGRTGPSRPGPILPACAATPGCGPPLRADPPSPRSPKPNRCTPFPPHRIR